MINKLIKRVVLNRKGQTLIEVVVTMGVALIIVTSIVSLVNASNRRATIARQATQSSKLAQEGMEIVRNIRDGRQNTVKVGTSTTNVDCSTGSFCTWNDLYTETQGPVPLAACLFLDSEWTLIGINEGNCDDEKVGGSLGGPSGSGIFNREITIYDNKIGSPARICSSADLEFSEVKRVSVKVTWESPIGNQDREVISCLTNWR